MDSTWISKAGYAASLLASCLCLFNINCMIASAGWASYSWSRVEEVFLLTMTKYKVYGEQVGTTAYMCQRKLVIDTGAGPKCIG